MRCDSGESEEFSCVPRVELCRRGLTSEGGHAIDEEFTRIVVERFIVFEMACTLCILHS